MFSNMLRLILLLAIFSCSSNNEELVNNFSSDIDLYKAGMNNLKKENFLMLLISSLN